MNDPLPSSGSDTGGNSGSKAGGGFHIPVPRIFGEVHDKDTKFMHAVKTNQEAIILGLGGFLIALIVYCIVLYEPARLGTWRYGVCKVFLERYAQYPTDVHILTAGERQSSAQIGYLTTNSYGSNEARLMECFYTIESNQVQISRVTLDRVPLDTELLKPFNPTIPIIMGREDLDLVLPDRMPNDLIDLKFYY